MRHLCDTYATLSKVVGSPLLYDTHPPASSDFIVIHMIVHIIPVPCHSTYRLIHQAWMIHIAMKN